MNAREAILAGVREALAGAPEPAPVPRDYRRPAGAGSSVDLFVERVQDYRAVVTRCTVADLPAAVAAAVPAGGRIVVPADLPYEIAGAEPDQGQSAAELDGFDAVVTSATVAIAETGTLVLTHGAGEGRRALSLVPDLHLCILRSDQVVSNLTLAVAQLDPTRPTTWISGPSATSDIELERVEGVHGPRTLHVLLIDTI